MGHVETMKNEIGKSWRIHVDACDGGLPALVAAQAEKGLIDFGIDIDGDLVSNRRVMIHRCENGTYEIMVRHFRAYGSNPAVTDKETLDVIERWFAEGKKTIEKIDADELTKDAMLHELEFVRNETLRTSQVVLTQSHDADCEVVSDGWAIKSCRGDTDDLVKAFESVTKVWPSILAILSGAGEDITGLSL